MLDNDDIKALLLSIKRQAFGPYPFPDGSQVDDRYAMALGLIAGICTEAVRAVNQNRKANFVIEAKNVG